MPLNPSKRHWLILRPAQSIHAHVAQLANFMVRHFSTFWLLATYTHWRNNAVTEKLRYFHCNTSYHFCVCTYRECVLPQTSMGWRLMRQPPPPEGRCLSSSAARQLSPRPQQSQSAWVHAQRGLREMSQFIVCGTWSRQQLSSTRSPRHSA